jgi:hypothetical protein
MSVDSSELGTRTSMYSILCIGIRLCAVLLAVGALLSIPTAVSSLNHGDWSSTEILWLSVLWGFILLFAFLLWLNPGMLAKLAAGRASQQVFESSIDAEELQQIAFTIVGLWIFVEGVLGLSQMALREVFVEHVLRNTTIADESIRARLVTDCAVQVLRIVMGCVLMLRAQGLVGLLRRYREAGLRPAIGDSAAEVTERP